MNRERLAQKSPERLYPFPRKMYTETNLQGHTPVATAMESFFPDTQDVTSPRFRSALEEDDAWKLLLGGDKASLQVETELCCLI